MADIVFKCSNCRQQLEVDEAGAGVTVPCPTCGTSLTIPSAEQAPTRVKLPEGFIQKRPSASAESSSKAEPLPQASERGSGRDQFHIHLGGKVQGPYMLQQLEQLYGRGVVQSDTACMKNNSDDWHPISEIIPMLESAPATPSRSSAVSAVEKGDSRESALVASNAAISGAVPSRESALASGGGSPMRKWAAWLVVIGILGLAIGYLTKGVEVSGEVYIVTNAGENIRLGLVEIRAIPRKAVIRHVDQKNLTAKTKLQHLKETFENDDNYYKRMNLIRERTEKIVKDAEMSGKNSSLAIAEAMAAAQPVFEKAADAEIKRTTSLEAYQSYPSAKFFFDGLPSGIASTRTDSEGRYKIRIPRWGRYALAAHASRPVGTSTEEYYWLVWVEPKGRSCKLTLSNYNLATSGAIESAITAKSSSFDLRD